MIEADIAVIGAGPAGAVCALNLAPLHRVLLIDRQVEPRARIGESLIPAVRRLFGDMRLWDSFVAQGHMPHHGNRSIWGSPGTTETQALRDLDGAGWHLDRARFEQWLRGHARDRGAAILTGTFPRDLRQSPTGWCFELEIDGRAIPACARLIVDATGRSASIARSLGARRTADDRLVCGWFYCAERDAMASGLTDIQAEADGWWYTAPLPSGRRVIAFHTDADLPAAEDAADPDRLRGRLRDRGMLSDLLHDIEPGSVEAGFCAAHGAMLDRPVGSSWLAVGDAALSFDPLSSQGLFNAIYTGLAGAESADRHLSGDGSALGEYASRIASIRDAYQTHLSAWYGMERRWADQPFWRRRLVMNPSVPA